MNIHNPILPGFNPDPSICRFGDDYYIATSTFEWFPGVALYHSKDLVNWHPIGHVLTRRSQLDLLGVTDSSGIWAPSLSYAEGQFYLIYTIVRTRATNFKDVHNYLVASPTITGPWSEPIYLNSSGFDPSLFHDEDGRKWLVNMSWDFRPGKPRFAGILLQEYSPSERKLVGPVTKILQKPILSEGPNLYKRNGWYYLMLAEGGTGWNHGIAMARSRSLTGPYELDPQPLVITSRKNPALQLQKAGHGELVQTPAGEWYLVHLASRPVYPERRCVLGRETCIQKVIWSEDGWLRLAHGGTDPLVEAAAPTGITPHEWPADPVRDGFDQPQLSPRWQSLRVPIDDSWLSLTDRPGWLRVRGRESQHSVFEQSLIAQRLTRLPIAIQTSMQFDPQNFMQSAGLILYYDTRNHYYLRMTHDESEGKVLLLTVTDDGNYSEPGPPLIINDWEQCFLRAAVGDERTQFWASPDAVEWLPVGPPLDTTKLSDDYGSGLKFTGTMIGICCQDLAGTRAIADFDYFAVKTVYTGSTESRPG
jgi:xylan 1,4-beta-xylosidase